MFPGLAVRVKNFAANMGSGFVVIAGFLLAITMVFVIVFARWNGVNSSSTYSVNADKLQRFKQKWGGYKKTVQSKG